MKYKLQKLGTGLLIAATMLLLMMSFTWCYIALGGVLAIDLFLVYKKQKTITQWYRTILPKLPDTILTIALCALFVWMHNPVVGLYFLMGTISGHLNGDW